MPVLAIETATRYVGCALWADGGPVASFGLVAAQRHDEVLMPAIDQLCRCGGLTVADIEGVAVDVGPGLFSGLRVGLATATTIARARELACVGVTSLEVLAHPHRRRPGLLAAVVDARRAEVYWALYRSDGTALQQVLGPAVAAPEGVARELAALGEASLVVGDGARRYQEELAKAGAEVAGPADMWPSPLVVAELGAQRLADGEGLAPLAPPAPMYLRQADVRIGWDQVGGRVGPPAVGAPVEAQP